MLTLLGCLATWFISRFLLNYCKRLYLKYCLILLSFSELNLVMVLDMNLEYNSYYLQFSLCLGDNSFPDFTITLTIRWFFLKFQSFYEACHTCQIKFLNTKCLVTVPRESFVKHIVPFAVSAATWQCCPCPL